MPDILIPEFKDRNGSSWMKSLERKLRHGVEWKRAHYAARQAEIKRHFKELDLRDIGRKIGSPGFMRPIAVIDGHTYQKWQQEDTFFWEDDKNVKDFLRDNPECKVEDNNPTTISTG